MPCALAALYRSSLPCCRSNCRLCTVADIDWIAVTSTTFTASTNNLPALGSTTIAGLRKSLYPDSLERNTVVAAAGLLWVDWHRSRSGKRATTRTDIYLLKIRFKSSKKIPHALDPFYKEQNVSVHLRYIAPGHCCWAWCRLVPCSATVNRW